VKKLGAIALLFVFVIAFAADSFDSDCVQASDPCPNACFCQTQVIPTVPVIDPIVSAAPSMELPLLRPIPAQVPFDKSFFQPPRASSCLTIA
jgi:hypothetical protein